MSNSVSKNGMKKDLSFVALYQKYGVLAILIIEIIVFAIFSKQFFNADNLLTIARQVSFTGISAVGCTFLMINGGIDLSNGANVALSGVVVTTLMVNHGFPIWLSIIITLIIGFIAGAVNGIACTYWRISPLIATLAMQYILKGFAFIITDAMPVYGLPESFKFLGQGYIFGVIPVPLLIMIAVFGFGFWLLNYSYFGRYIYAIGGNVEAARLSGINTKRISLIVFAASGLFASFAGVLTAARLGTGMPSVGHDFPMEVITAIVLGGVSIVGGSGKITGVFVGTFIMGILSNGMIMLGISDYVQWIVKGIVLMFAVAMSNLNVSKSYKKQANKSIEKAA